MNDRGEKDLFAVLDAIAAWPEVPSPHVLALLGANVPAGDNDDWKRGKVMQRELPMGAVPYTYECEAGAGVWDRITNGAWRDHLPEQDK